MKATIYFVASLYAGTINKIEFTSFDQDEASDHYYTCLRNLNHEWAAFTNKQLDEAYETIYLPGTIDATEYNRDSLEINIPNLDYWSKECAHVLDAYEHDRRYLPALELIADMGFALSGFVNGHREATQEEEIQHAQQ